MTEQDIDLQSLGLFDDGEEPIDLDNLPQERSSLPREIPQPGTLLLRVPGGLKPQDFKPVTDQQSRQRLSISFKDDIALKMVKSGGSLNYNVTDFERALKVKNEAGEEVYKTTSEMAQFLKGLGHTGTLASKADKIKAVLAAQGKDFLADLFYRADCNPKRPIYKEGAKQAQTGCGAKYRMEAQEYVNKKTGQKVTIKQIPQDAAGKWMGRFPCGCGAELMSFVGLSNYRAAR